MLSPWSKNKERKFKRLYPTTPDDELAKMLKMSHGMIIKKADELNLEKADQEEEWTPSDDLILTSGFELTSNDSLSHVLDKNKASIEHRAYQMGLRKDTNYYDIDPDDNRYVELWEQWWKESNKKKSKKHYLTGKALHYIFPMYRIEEEMPIGNLWLDWAVPQLNLAFEVQGEQHLEFNDHFYDTKFDFERAKDRDMEKDQMCESSGIALIHLYPDEGFSINLLRQKIEDVT